MSGNTVCLLRSTDTGAPVLSGSAGALTALLDACLQDGYNSKTIQSITRSGAVATATYATAHNYAADGLTKVAISGCAQTEYNGIQQISNVSTNAFDFTVAGTPASGSGTMVSKAAHLGWSKAFTGTNKAVYRGNEVTGTRLYLWVDDANPNANTNKSAALRGYETMTDLNTGTGPFPTVAQMAGGVFLNKSTTADSTARAWVLVGDGFEFHLFYANNPNYAMAYRQFHFGDPASEQASDPYGCLIYGDYAVSESAQEDSQSSFLLSASTATQIGHYFARSYTQIGNPVAASKQGNKTLGGIEIGGSGLLPYPSPNNNGLYVAPIFAAQGALIRAQLKGTYQPLHVRPLGNAALVPASASPIGHRLYAITTAYTASLYGETHLDIDGPWR